jgi:hypothetical protein
MPDLAAGDNVKIVQERVGHASAKRYEMGVAL